MRLLAPLLAVLALTAAGCGGSDSSSSSSSDAGSSSPSGTSTPATPNGGVSADAVAIKDFSFQPADITVKVGQKVTWTNEDSAVHNVIANDGPLKSPDLEQGQSYSFTAKEPGTFSYICTFHPNMKGTLTVTS